MTHPAADSHEPSTEPADRAVPGETAEMGAAAAPDATVDDDAFPEADDGESLVTLVSESDVTSPFDAESVAIEVAAPASADDSTLERTLDETVIAAFLGTDTPDDKAVPVVDVAHAGPGSVAPLQATGQAVPEELDASYQSHFFDDAQDPTSSEAFQQFAARGGATVPASPAAGPAAAMAVVVEPVPAVREPAAAASTPKVEVVPPRDVAPIVARATAPAPAPAAAPKPVRAPAVAPVRIPAPAPVRTQAPTPVRDAPAPIAIVRRPRAVASPSPKPAIGYEFDVRPGHDIAEALAPIAPVAAAPRVPQTKPAAARVAAPVRPPVAPTDSDEDRCDEPEADEFDDEPLDYESASEPSEEAEPVAAGPGGGGWTIPLLCAGIGLIACCLLIPLTDSNRRLAYERLRLRQDLESIQTQVAVNDSFLRRVHDDPSLAERLAQRQMKTIREGTRVLELDPGGSAAGGTDTSPFQIVAVQPPPPLPEYRPVGGTIARLCYKPRTRLYLTGAGLMMMAAGLVLGAAPRCA